MNKIKKEKQDKTNRKKQHYQQTQQASRQQALPKLAGETRRYNEKHRRALLLVRSGSTDPFGTDAWVQLTGARRAATFSLAGRRFSLSLYFSDPDDSRSSLSLRHSVFPAAPPLSRRLFL